VRRALVIALGLCASHAGALPHDLEQHCERWRGLAQGNEPDVLNEFRLCRTGDRVEGTTRWSSSSGEGACLLAGTYHARSRTYRLRDVRFIVNRPAPGHRFCLVDQYELRKLSEQQMTGRSDSWDCDDHASFALRRVD
jgi:hypothetical protein